jgi:hypothetical protein
MTFKEQREYATRLNRLRGKLDYCIGLVYAREYKMANKQLLNVSNEVNKIYYDIDEKIKELSL